jgi:hypothetical protein
MTIHLEGFLEIEKLLLALLHLGLRLVIWGLKEQFQLIPHFNHNLKGLLDISVCPFLLKEMLDGDDANEVFLVVPLTVG